MEFVYPSFLFALFALSVPVIIHLFNFRRYKTLKFTNVRFLQSVKEQTQSQSVLRHLLVLFCRLLALACLVFAFAQPFIPVEDSHVSKGQKAVSIYIDNSFSMEAKATEGSLINIAKNKAIRILDAYGEGDQFQILTNDFEGKHQRLLNKSTFIEYLQDIELSPRTKNIEQVFNRQKDLLKNYDPNARQFFHISDLQKATYTLPKIQNDSSRIRILPVQAENTSNLYIDSVWFSSPIRKAGDKVNLKVKIINNGDEKLENVPINLEINGQSKTPQVFDIEAEDELIVDMIYISNRTGWVKGKVSIKDYPVSFDDNFYFSYEQAEEISVLHIFDQKASAAIPALFENDDFFEFSQQNYKQLNYSKLNQYQFLVLDELEQLPSGLVSELKKFVENGGSISIFPPLNANLQEYNRALNQLGIETYAGIKSSELNVSDINLNSELFIGVFEEKPENINLPKVKNYYRLNNYTSSNKENILSLQNGDAFLNLYNLGNGKIYLFAASMEEEQGNLTNHAIFVPTVYNMALLSQPRQKLYHFIGEEQLRISGLEMKESPFHLVGNNLDIIPEQRMLNGQLVLDFHNKINVAGFYDLLQNDEQKANIALNYNRKESDLEVYQINDIEQIAEQNALGNIEVLEQTKENLSNTLKNINKGIPLWKYFIIGTLIFLALEILFLRILR